MPLDAILSSEEAILERLVEQDIYDDSSDDILPTSSKDGACTALITKIRLDTKEDKITLRIRYHEQQEITAVLRNGETASEYFRKRAELEDGEVEETDELRSATRMAT